MVEAAVTDADPSATSASVTVILVDERLSAAADVASVVEGASGVVVRRFGGLGDYSGVSIRGSGLRQVQVFLDGVPLNPDGSGVVNLAELPLRAFERVEIYRGNAPARFGAAPVGGVVNLVTGTGGAQTQGSVATGAHGTARMTGSTGVTGTMAGRPADILTFAELFSTRGDYPIFTNNGTVYEVFDDARTNRENNDKDQLSAHLRGRVGDQLQLTLGEAWLSREEGLPGHVNSPARSVRLRTFRNLLNVQFEAHPGDVELVQRTWSLWRQEHFDDRDGEIGTGNQWAEYQTRTDGAMAHAAWARSSRWVPALTVTARRDRYVETNLLTHEVADPRLRWAGSGALSLDGFLWGDRVRISPVAEWHYLDNRLLGTVPFSTTDMAPEGEHQELVATPRAGLLIRPLPSLALKTNGGRTFRPPDFTELFGDRGAVIGNTELLPERGWQWDAGLRATPWGPGGAASIDATFFQNRVHDQIIFVQNGQGTSVPINFGETWVQGVESALDLRPARWLDSRSNATWTRSRNLTPRRDVANKQLPRVPTWDVSQATSVHWKERVRLGHQYSFTSGNYWDATNWFLAPPRVVHSAFLRGAVETAGRALSAELSVLNLLDQHVALVDRNPLDKDDDTLVVQSVHDFFGYPLPGRTWLVTLRWGAPPPTTES